ncbi:hypothetical protein ACLQ2N_08365 [Streptomyces sp. DT224]|uniref:hypothetical protein n=1 Tax=Streptomyces sp. DT224 TaxID=3393426 RepID=UPI003CF9AAEF
MTYPSTQRSRIPDAVAAIVAAVIEDHPNAGPDAIGRLAVAELAREGWHWHLGAEVMCAPPRVSRGPARPSAAA